MGNAKPQDVDSYIAAAEDEARPILEELRQLIRSAVPGVEEKISWGMPFYRYQGAIGGYAVYKKHVSFGIDSALAADDRDALERGGYKTGKKTVQIALGQKVPAAAIRRIVKAQVRANNARGRSSAG